MEILKFDDSGSTSPSRKRSGRGAILVTFVALVFGAGTALASGTLAINTDNTIALDQGVAQTVQCDPDGVDISLSSSLQIAAGEESKFYLSGVTVSKIADNCIGKDFRVRVYNAVGAAQVFCSPAPTDSGCSGDGTYIQGEVTNAGALFTNQQSINFVVSQVLYLQNSTVAKNITIETIG